MTIIYCSLPRVWALPYLKMVVPYPTLPYATLPYPTLPYATLPYPTQCTIYSFLYIYTINPYIIPCMVTIKNANKNIIEYNNKTILRIFMLILILLSRNCVTICRNMFFTFSSKEIPMTSMFYVCIHNMLRL